MEVPDNPDTDIRDGQDMSDTQREGDSGFTTEGGGGRLAPEPQGSPRGARAVPTFFTEVRLRDSGPDQQKDGESPVDILVDTVARMQQDLASLRAENREHRPSLRWCVPLGRRRLQRQKYHDLTERLVGNNIDKCLTLSYGRMAGTMIRRHCSCSPIWRVTR